MSLILNFVYSFFGTIGYAIFFQLPKKLIFYAGLVGACGWMLNIVLVGNGSSVAFSNMICAILVAMLSEFFARISKNPVTMFIIPGILPLTPGYSLYMTMRYITSGDLIVGLTKGFDTIASAGAIAVGIMIVSSFGKIARNLKAKKLQRDRRDV